jgi:hypothetical protein
VPNDVCIGDFAFEDTNGNGIQDAGEQGVSGVTVTAYTCNTPGTTPTPGSGFLSGVDLTDANGIYQICLQPGNYYVVFSGLGSGASFTVPNVGNPAIDSDANPNGGTVCFNVPPNSPPIDSIDVGIKTPASLGDFVFEDLDGDGIQDAGEPGIPNAFVTLYDATITTIIGVTQTDANGFYQFTGLNPGGYLVEFSTPTNFIPVPANQGGDDTRDSDAGVNGRTGVINLVSGQNDDTNDAGFTRPAALGDFVFNDLNNNGIQDPNETGISGVTVRLFDGGNNQVGSTTTGVNGGYVFTNLTPT